MLKKKSEENVTLMRVLRNNLKISVEYVRSCLGKLSLSQLIAAMLLSYFVVWPSLKPEMRNFLLVIRARILKARDVFIGSIATRLIGITTTGLILSARSSRAVSDDKGSNDGTNDVSF